MKIQDIENRTGLERPTIRYYEREGLIDPKRSENGYREYSDEDAAQLMKIKLLRQLGMSIEKIRALQQGSADFSAEMDAQIHLLTGQMEQNRRAREVCRVMRSDGVDYKTMDPEHYLKLLREMPTEQTGTSIVFQEKLEKEIHPWRRYWARSLDYMLFGSLIDILLYVVLRLRPIPGDFASTLIGIGSILLFVPIEALMLSKWGTTPGKWAMGIRLEYMRGGNLPFSAAIYRSVRVLAGVGLGIPCVEQICLIQSYCKLTGRSWHRFVRHDDVSPPADMEWDEETEIIYHKWEGKGKSALAGLLAAYLIVTGLSVMDMVKPKHRGSDLTIAQFAENYNATLRLLNEEYDTYDKLQSDGSKYPVPGQTAVIHFGSESENENRELIYETKYNILQTVGYANKWTDVFYVQPLSNECYIAATSLLLAQEGCSIREMLEFSKLWESMQNDLSACFTYKNLEIRWDITYENCVYSNGILFSMEETQESNAAIAFEIRISEK